MNNEKLNESLHQCLSDLDNFIALNNLSDETEGMWMLDSALATLKQAKKNFRQQELLDDALIIYELS